ncbi:hypothetical protein P7C73_g208, partial [Tremellales sp. Uapishka_1]
MPVTRGTSATAGPSRLPFSSSTPRRGSRRTASESAASGTDVSRSEARVAKRRRKSHSKRQEDNNTPRSRRSHLSHSNVGAQPRQPSPRKRILGVRASLTGDLVKELTIQQRAQTVADVAGDCVLKLLRFGRDDHPAGWQKDWDALVALRRSSLFSAQSQLFPSFLEAINDFSPRNHEAILRHPVILTRAINLSNLATFVKIILEPEDAVDLVDDSTTASAHNDKARNRNGKGKEKAVDAIDTERERAAKRDRVLMLAWKQYWFVVVPREKRDNSVALRLWLDFATQIQILSQNSTTLPPSAEHTGLNETADIQQRVLFASEALQDCGHWKPSENFDSSSGSESAGDRQKFKMDRLWMKLAARREKEVDCFVRWNDFRGTDPYHDQVRQLKVEVLMERYPYEVFRREMLSFIQQEVAGATSDSHLTPGHRRLLHRSSVAPAAVSTDSTDLNLDDDFGFTSTGHSGDQYGDVPVNMDLLYEAARELEEESKRGASEQKVEPPTDGQETQWPMRSSNGPALFGLNLLPKPAFDWTARQPNAERIKWDSQSPTKPATPPSPDHFGAQLDPPSLPQPPTPESQSATPKLPVNSLQLEDNGGMLSVPPSNERDSGENASLEEDALGRQGDDLFEAAEPEGRRKLAEGGDQPPNSKIESDLGMPQSVTDSPLIDGSRDPVVEGTNGTSRAEVDADDDDLESLESEFEDLPSDSQLQGDLPSENEELRTPKGGDEYGNLPNAEPLDNNVQDDEMTSDTATPGPVTIQPVATQARSRTSGLDEGFADLSSDDEEDEALLRRPSARAGPSWKTATPIRSVKTSSRSEIVRAPRRFEAPSRVRLQIPDLLRPPSPPPSRHRARAQTPEDVYMFDSDRTPLLPDDTYLIPKAHIARRSRIHGRVGDQATCYSRKTGRVRKWTKQEDLLLYRTIQKVPLEEEYPCRVVWYLHGEYGTLSHELEQFNPQHMKDKMRTMVETRRNQGKVVEGRARYWLKRDHPLRIEFDDEMEVYKSKRFEVDEDEIEIEQLELKKEEDELESDAEEEYFSVGEEDEEIDDHVEGGDAELSEESMDRRAQESTAVTKTSAAPRKANPKGRARMIPVVEIISMRRKADPRPPGGPVSPSRGDVETPFSHVEEDDFPESFEVPTSSAPAPAQSRKRPRSRPPESARASSQHPGKRLKIAKTAPIAEHGDSSSKENNNTVLVDVEKDDEEEPEEIRHERIRRQVMGM